MLEDSVREKEQEFSRQMSFTLLFEYFSCDLSMTSCSMELPLVLHYH